MNVHNGEILAAIPLPDDISKSSEKGILVQTYLAPIMPILDVSPFSVFLNNNSYSIFINSLEK